MPRHQIIINEISTSISSSGESQAVLSRKVYEQEFESLDLREIIVRLNAKPRKIRKGAKS